MSSKNETLYNLIQNCSRMFGGEIKSANFVNAVTKVILNKILLDH